ncbi:hypothetical protein J4Q44_G00371740 [Coregonus suidteri]|uniref:Uncharacterized protein n=1 Tax=Coregonus suidteri TaxID=861788 RepID=A0AAN8KNX0_9TELE
MRKPMSAWFGLKKAQAWKQSQSLTKERESEILNVIRPTEESDTDHNQHPPAPKAPNSPKKVSSRPSLLLSVGGPQSSSSKGPAAHQSEESSRPCSRASSSEDFLATVHTQSSSSLGPAARQSEG